MKMQGMFYVCVLLVSSVFASIHAGAVRLVEVKGLAPGDTVSISRSIYVDNVIASKLDSIDKDVIEGLLGGQAIVLLNSPMALDIRSIYMANLRGGRSALPELAAKLGIEVGQLHRFPMAATHFSVGVTKPDGKTTYTSIVMPQEPGDYALNINPDGTASLDLVGQAADSGIWAAIKRCIGGICPISKAKAE